MVGAVVVGGVQAAGGPLFPGAAILLLATVSLRWPAVALPVTAAACVSYHLLGCPPGPEPVPFVVALYLAAAAGWRRLAIATVPLAVGLVVGADLAAGRPAEGEDLIAVAAVVVAAVGLGELSRSRAEQRDAGVRRAAAEERLRIARELHDTLAHQLTAISVQAGAALRKRESRPELAYPALETVRQVAGEALTEVRSVLGVLRAPTAPPSIPTLAAVAGLDVTVDVRGPVADLPPDVDAAVRRIAQEALTNVRRHAGVTAAEVRLSYRRRRVEIEVLDSGAGRPFEAGHGIVGMRERATAFGGRFSAGPRPDGGFRVWASIPR